MGRIVDAVLLLLAAAAVALMGWSVIGKSRTSSPSTATEAELVAALIGLELPAVRVSASTGRDSVIFDPTGTISIVLILSTTCPACERTREVWHSLVEMAPAEVRVVLISHEDPELVAEWFAVGRQLPWAGRFSILQVEEPLIWPVRAVPTTLLIDRSGYVIAAKVGVLQEADTPMFIEPVMGRLVSQRLEAGRSRARDCLTESVV